MQKLAVTLVIRTNDITVGTANMTECAGSDHRSMLIYYSCLQKLNLAVPIDLRRMRFTTQWRAAFRVKSFKAVVIRGKLLGEGEGGGGGQ